MESIRKLTKQEERLLLKLLENSSLKFTNDYIQNILVQNMNDGKMGSLLIYPKDTIKKIRKFNKQISEYQYQDSDGIEVIVSLNIDQDNDLYELDIWKTNFDSIIDLFIK